MKSNIQNKDQNSGDVINLRELTLKYLRKWPWFFLGVVLSMTVAFLFLKMTQEKYEVKATILLRNDNSGGMSMPRFDMMENLGIGGMNKDVEDEIHVLSSNKLIRGVIDTLDIQAKYYQKSKLRYVEEYGNMPFRLDMSKETLDTITTGYQFKIKEKNGKFYVGLKIKKQFKGKFVLNSISEPMETPLGIVKFTQTGKIGEDSRFKVKLIPKDELIDAYRENIKVGTINKQTNVIRLSLTEANIKKTRDILDHIVVQYNKDANEDKNLIVKNTSEFIDERLAIITSELFEVEADVEEYKKRNKLTDLSAEAEIFLKSADEYEKVRTEYEIQLNMVKSVESYIADPKNANSLIPANVVSEDKTLALAIQEYNTALLERMKMVKSAGPENPTILMADEHLHALRGNVLASVKSVKGGLEIALNDLKRKDNAFLSRIKNIPTQERQFLEIKRQQGIKQTLYLFLFQKKEENAIKLASTPPAARVVDQAYASLKPVFPKLSIVLLVAMVLGMFVPFSVIYLRDLFNNKIEDPKEFQKSVEAPFLGNIAVNSGGDFIVVKEGSTTPLVELFRLLRTNLQFMISKKKGPVILVTSSFSGEGKSFISANLAMSFTLMKKRVVLVGLDIRSPMLGDYLNLSNDLGATVFLSDKSLSLKDMIQSSGINSNLDVITAGPIPPNPSELLMSERLEEMMDELKEMYDYVIVDTAPIGMVSDTYLLNRIADNSVYVARQNYTPRDTIALINQIESENKLNGLGVVLNGTSLATGYGYGYGYGSEVKTVKTPLLKRASNLFIKG